MIILVVLWFITTSNSLNVSQCVDPLSTYIGVWCADIVTWTYWVPSDKVSAQFYAIVGTQPQSREIACAMIYPKCSSSGLPLPLCKADCDRWNSKCYGIPVTVSNECTPVKPVVWSGFFNSAYVITISLLSLLLVIATVIF
jgi:hypothetical protein